MTTKTRRLIPPRHELVGDLSSIVGRSTWLTSGFTDGLAGYRLTGLSLVGPPGGCLSGRRGTNALCGEWIRRDALKAGKLIEDARFLPRLLTDMLLVRTKPLRTCHRHQLPSASLGIDRYH
jgi:hypothetical protein